MRTLGFNLRKGELYFCCLSGSKEQPVYEIHGRHKFEPTQSRPDLSNFFKQTFAEILESQQVDLLSYRLSLDAKSSDQIAYLTFPFGVLNLLAFEKGLPIREYTTQSFTKKALGFEGDKFKACDDLIKGCPTDWKEPVKLAALSAWMAL